MNAGKYFLALMAQYFAFGFKQGTFLRWEWLLVQTLSSLVSHLWDCRMDFGCLQDSDGLRP